MGKKQGIEITLDDGKEFLAAIKKVPRGRGAWGSPGGIKVWFPVTAVKLGMYQEEAEPESTDLAKTIFNQVACSRCNVGPLTGDSFKKGQKIEWMPGSSGGDVLTRLTLTCSPARSEGEKYTPCQGIKDGLVEVVMQPGKEARVIKRRTRKN